MTEKHRTELQQHVARATEALQKIRVFDPDTIARRDELGAEFGFEASVEDAERLISLFGLIRPEVLPELPLSVIHNVSNHANNVLNLLEKFKDFSPATAQPSPTKKRNDLIDVLHAAYSNVFDAVANAILYSQSTAFSDEDLRNKMDEQFGSVLAAIEARKAEAEARVKEIDSAKKKAMGVLDAIQKASAEAAVSKEAVHFKGMADAHQKGAKRSLYAIGGGIFALFAFAIGSLFLHTCDTLVPGKAPTYETVQLGVSKFLMFAALTYGIILGVRVYLAHRHNEVVNRHRQIALMTYRALVEAAGDQANRDVVLTKAAESIFGAQPSGFNKGDGDEGKALSLVQVAPGLLKPPTGSNPP
ncbi:hypothetical protein [Haliangium sp.]|uniref:hypothetical protein n=1 Tax=Haliangium sp. TaxID=2663208 RepID=UPI003D131C51